MVYLDEELFIRKAFEEDPKKGWELLFREYYTPLCSHAIRYVYSREAARDLVSEAFYVFWQKEIYLHITTSYRAYLYTMVRHRGLKYLQREFNRDANVISIEAFDSEDGAFVAHSLTPEDILSYDELSQKVESVIDNLSPQSRKVFMMNRFEGKRYQAIAEELQITLKTVEAHMSKALAGLRKALKNDGAWLVLYFFIS